MYIRRVQYVPISSGVIYFVNDVIIYQDIKSKTWKTPYIYQNIHHTHKESDVKYTFCHQFVRVITFTALNNISTSHGPAYTPHVSTSMENHVISCIIPQPGIDIVDGLAPAKGSTNSSLNVKFHINGLLSYKFQVHTTYHKVKNEKNPQTITHFYPNWFETMCNTPILHVISLGQINPSQTYCPEPPWLDHTSPELHTCRRYLSASSQPHKGRAPAPQSPVVNMTGLGTEININSHKFLRKKGFFLPNMGYNELIFHGIQIINLM